MEDANRERVEALEFQVRLLVVGLVLTTTLTLGVSGVALIVSLVSGEEPSGLGEVASGSGGARAVEPAGEDDGVRVSFKPGEGGVPDVIEAREFRVVDRVGGPALVRLGYDPIQMARGGGWVEVASRRGIPLARIGPSEEGHGEVSLTRYDGGSMIDIGTGLSGMPGGAVVYSPDLYPFAWVGFDKTGGFGLFQTERASTEESVRRAEDGIDF